MSDDLQQTNEALKTENAALRSDRMRDGVKVAALQQGLLDASDLDRIPLEGVAFAQDGSITGAAEFIQKLKTSKSHWFHQDSQSANRDRSGRQVPRMADVSKIKPGSPEHKKLEAEYLARWQR